MRALADTAMAGWPLAATLALVLVRERVRRRRAREAIGRALHELRRPLQALLLGIARGTGRRLADGLDGQIELARLALADLERTVHGDRLREAPRPVLCRSVVDAAVARWDGDCGPIEVVWEADGAVMIADPGRVAQAIDNLIANARQHGRPPIVLAGSVRAERLRIAVRDGGCSAARRGRPRPTDVPARHIAGLGWRHGGAHAHGHGLKVVASVAAAHGGRFAIHRAEAGTIAILELPLAGAGATRVA